MSLTRMTKPLEIADDTLEWVRPLADSGSPLRKVRDARGFVGAGVGFERTRRITGYLVGALDRFNDAKRAEERDRQKHG